MIDIESISSEILHIWHIHMPDFFYLRQYKCLLTQEQCTKRDRFIFEKHQIRFDISKKILKLLLSKYLGMLPEDLLFLTESKGKPFLASYPFHFNLSHTGEYLAIAIHKTQPLGVDIEQMKKRDFIGLARHSFSESEQRQILATSSDKLDIVFYKIWTQKEAFIKQCGQGLSYPLKDFSVNGHGEGGLLEAVEQIKRDFYLKTYKAHVGIQAAICLPNKVKEIMHFSNNDLADVFKDIKIGQ